MLPIDCTERYTLPNCPCPISCTSGQDEYQTAGRPISVCVPADEMRTRARLGGGRQREHAANVSSSERTALLFLP